MMSFSETVFIGLFCFGGGYVLGHLTRNLRTWKLFLLMLMGAYLYVVVSHDLSQVQIAAVLAGMVSHHAGRFFSALSWAGNLGDMIFAFRYRSAFEDIKRRERELNEREQRLREEERRRAYAEQERGQRARAGWQKEARGFRGKADDKAGSGSQKQDAPRGTSSAGSNEKRQQEQEERNAGSHRPPPQNGVRDRHLQVLGLEPGREYTQVEIKKAYRRAAMEAHPDTGGSDEAFIAVQQAFEWLRA